MIMKFSVRQFIEYCDLYGFERFTYCRDDPDWYCRDEEVASVNSYNDVFIVNDQSFQLQNMDESVVFDHVRMVCVDNEISSVIATISAICDDSLGTVHTIIGWKCISTKVC